MDSTIFKFSWLSTGAKNRPDPRKRLFSMRHGLYGQNYFSCLMRTDIGDEKFFPYVTCGSGREQKQTTAFSCLTLHQHLLTKRYERMEIKKFYEKIPRAVRCRNRPGVGVFRTRAILGRRHGSQYDRHMKHSTISYVLIKHISNWITRVFFL